MKQNPFELLSAPIQKYIYEQKWDALRPIQAAAIGYIMKSEKNYILASRTASGKTEAAFLPALSSVDFKEEGVQVLYISPLIALINDQIRRVEDLCAHLDVLVTKWHGEAKLSAKKRLIKQPSGVVLITPESIEAMFINKPYQVKAIFSNLKFVIVDEIHYFIGTDRGVQLKSLISRLQRLQNSPFRCLGLSATIGDFEQAKATFGDVQNTLVIRDAEAQPINAEFKYYPDPGTGDLSLDLLKDLYRHCRDSKNLVFPNSRGRVEEVAVKLKTISNRVGGHNDYYSHHSAIDKDNREHIESFAKSSSAHPFTISCTSTLELGIDIGSIDKVVQVDSTHSVSSLIQRVGRSGRKEGAMSQLLLYATTPWSMLQSLACWNLQTKGQIEPTVTVDKPYDMFVHQLLSVVKERSGIELNLLVQELLANAAFRKITIEEVKQIVKHLLDHEIIEAVQSEIIIGVEGERIVNNRDIYSAFTTDTDLKVYHKSSLIGELTDSIQVQEDVNIYFAAKIWKIVSVDRKAHKVYVEVARDGKKPQFSGNPGTVPDIVAQEMHDILFSEQGFENMDTTAQSILYQLREKFSKFDKYPTASNHLLNFDSETNKIEYYPFFGSSKALSLKLVFASLGLEASMRSDNSFQVANISLKDFTIKLDEILAGNYPEVNELLLKDVQENPSSVSICSKWGYLLPESLQVELLKQKRYNFDFVG